MRHELIEALTYPRLLVQELIQERECPHENLFEATEERCHHCDVNKQCHWVSCLHDFSEFEGTPNHTLNASLRYGIKLVESLHNKLRHNETTCTCEPCTWVRDAQRLTEEFDAHLDTGIHGPMY
jgi:hypothetical protein